VVTLGCGGNRILFVRTPTRGSDEEIIRIVSAREATLTGAPSYREQG